MVFNFINLMKAVASCLVANSHFDGIWPISALATGGSLGNCLFFAASGFLLGNIKQDFVPWYLKKLVRIYPAVWIATTISLLFRSGISTGHLAGEYLFLFAYWFLRAIVVLYIPFYFIMKGKLRERIPIVIGCVAVFYFICYFAFMDIHIWTIEDDSCFKWIFYFAVFLLGGEYSQRVKNHRKIPGKVLSGWMTLAAFCAFYAFKFALDKVPALMPFQFIEHIFLGVFSYFMLPFMIALEPEFRKVSASKPWKAVEFISSITLEIFLVMDYVIHFAEKLSFPLSLVSAAAGIVIAAWLLHLIQTPISSRLSKLIENKRAAK